jgi:hypothetical protein
MRVALSNSRTLSDPEEPLTEIQYFCECTDLLQQMFLELQLLATQNPILAYTMFDGESDAFLHMRTLLETIDTLLCVKDLKEVIPLRRRAVTLISWLSIQVDKLMVCAARGETPVDTCEMQLH